MSSLSRRVLWFVLLLLTTALSFGLSFIFVYAVANTGPSTQFWYQHQIVEPPINTHQQICFTGPVEAYAVKLLPDEELPTQLIRHQQAYSSGECVINGDPRNRIIRIRSLVGRALFTTSPSNYDRLHNLTILYQLWLFLGVSLSGIFAAMIWSSYSESNSR